MATRNTIVAVGGTGTHVAISFLRMAIMSNMAVADIPNILIVDADVVKGNAESLTTIAKGLFDQVVTGATDKSRPVFEHIFPFSGGAKTVTANTAFGDYLLGEPLETAPPDSKQALDALFTRTVAVPAGVPLPRSEQDILIRDGFFARPSVGSTAIYDLLASGDRLTQVLLNLMQKDAACSGIAVVGSSTGGTGSGAAPSIAQWLEKEKGNPNRRASRARIGLFMTLPWFFPEPPTDPEKKPSNGDKATQRLNAASGIRLYSESETLKKSGVFLADFNGIQTARTDDGDSGQGENPHPLPLVFASQIQNFFLSAEGAANNQNDASAIEGEFTFFNLDSQAGNFVINAHDSPLTAFSATAQIRQDLYDWAVETQSMRLILKGLADFLRDDYRLFGKNDRRKVEPHFRNLMLALAEAKRPGAGTHFAPGVGFLGIGQVTVELPEIRLDLVKALRRREIELSESIEWLSRLVENSDSGGTKTFVISQEAVRVELQDPDCSLYPVFEKSSNPRPTIINVFDRSFNPNATEKSKNKSGESARLFGTLCGEQVGLDPDTAALVVIEQQIRSLMRITQEKRLGRRNTDATNVNFADATLNYLLPFKVKEIPVNQYLAKIELARLVDDGTDRNNVKRAKHQPEHPFTITGITSASIPSPWAAAHIQMWKQLHGDGMQKSLAVRSFEAVMWGIFTKRLTLKTLPLDRTRLGKMLKTSLESELSYQNAQIVNNLLVAVDAYRPEDVVATNHPNAGWFVAPWLLKEVEQEQVEGWWQLNRFNLKLPTESISQPLNSKDLNARQIRSFCTVLQEMSKLHTINANQPRSIPWYLVTTQIAAELEPAVRALEPVPYANTAFSMTVFGRNRQSQAYEFSPFSVPTLGRSLLEILRDYVPPSLVSVKLPNGVVRHPDRPVFSQHLGAVTACSAPIELLIPDADGHGNWYTLRYEITLDGLGVATVDCKSVPTTIEAYLAVFPNFVSPNWSQYFLGCVPKAAKYQPFSFSVFDAEGQRLGDKARSFGINHDISGVPKFIALMGDGSEDAVKLAGECGCFEIKLTELVAQNLQFRLGLDIGTSHSCFFPMDTNPTSTQPIAGIDFSRAGSALTYVMFDDNSLATSVKESTLFLGINSALGSDSNKLVLPSELRVQMREGHPLQTSMVTDTDAAKNFAPLPYEYAVAKSATQKGASGEFLNDFKWSVPAGQVMNHGLHATVFQNNQPQVLEVYMRHMLVVGFAMLRAQGFSDMVVLRATYPEAFNIDQLIVYADTLAKVITGVARATGVTLNLTNADTVGGLKNGTVTKEFLLYTETQNANNNRLVIPNDAHSGFVSESLAAIAANPAENLGAERGITLVLDMGGGTTDIAVYASGTRNAQIAGLESITDSVQYAGNDVLAMINTNAVYALMAQAVDPETKAVAFPTGAAGDKARLSLIKRMMRNPAAIITLKQAINDGQGAYEKIALKIDSFFMGLTQYACHLVKAYQPSFEHGEENAKGYWAVNVILIGNGWKLTDLIYQNGLVSAAGYLPDLSSAITTALGGHHRATVSVSYNTANVVSVKEAIAYGALRADALPRNIVQLAINKTVPGMTLEMTISSVQQDIAQHSLWEPGVRPDKLQAPNTIELKSDPFDMMEEAMIERYAELIDNNDKPRIQAILTARMNSEFVRRISAVRVLKRNLKISPYAVFLEGYWKNACLH